MTARPADIAPEKCVFYRENPTQTPTARLLQKRNGLRAFFCWRKRFHKIRHNDKLRQFLHPAVALPNKKDYTNLIDRRIQKLYRKDGWLI